MKRSIAVLILLVLNSALPLIASAGESNRVPVGLETTAEKAKLQLKLRDRVAVIVTDTFIDASREQAIRETFRTENVQEGQISVGVLVTF